MQALLETQRADFLGEGVVTAATRIDRLDRGIDALVRYADKLAEAVHTDFGCRPRQITLITDVGASIAPMKHARKHLRKWMKGEKRPTVFPLNLLGGRSRIEYQPLGVVGIVPPTVRHRQTTENGTAKSFSEFVLGSPPIKTP